MGREARKSGVALIPHVTKGM